MGKKILRVYLAKNDTPYSAAYAKLELPASPWELWDAMEKVRLQTDDILYMEIEDYFAFEYLSPHLDGLDISLNELNDLAAQLAALDEVQEIAFEGMFSIEVQRKVNANGGVITLQDLRDLAVSAKTDCYHVVDAADDAQLGRFYAENDFIPELDGVSDAVFKMLDFAGIGRMMRCSENGVFVGNLYVLRDGELTTAPPCAKDLPEKPGYLFRLTLGLHPDIGDDRTVTLILPAAEVELLDAQALTGPELLRRAAQDPAFAVFCPAPGESLSALTPPACMPDALRQEVQSSLSAAEEAPRLTACAALHRLASRCEAQSAEAAEHCRTARRLWPRLGGCLGALAAILLW